MEVGFEKTALDIEAETRAEIEVEIRTETRMIESGTGTEVKNATTGAVVLGIAKEIAVGVALEMRLGIETAGSNETTMRVEVRAMCERVEGGAEVSGGFIGMARGTGVGTTGALRAEGALMPTPGD